MTPPVAVESGFSHNRRLWRCSSSLASTARAITRPDSRSCDRRDLMNRRMVKRLRPNLKAHKLCDMGGRTSEQWIAQYASSHQHPVNRFCHTLGIPMIVIAIAWSAIAWLASAPLAVPIALFAAGRALQFVAHAYERKQP